ncbi:MAG TPA: helix-turn-helix domain-containing protein [Stellaceae bacterium]|nr:helix-turn-helix domain-containing protein [Stellaceae bacterium]
MITPAQCRSARALLGWSLAKLAAAASVTESSIDNFELERSAPDGATANAIEHAFAAVGVAFSPDGDDVRLLSPGEVSG